MATTRQADFARGHTALLNCDNHRWIVEMTIVRPPFVLDFSSANLGPTLDYSDEVLADRAAHNAKLIGKDWPEVELIIAAFERYGIVLADVRPGNIRVSP